MNIFNEAILNVLRNFIRHETVLCDDRDLPWFNDKIKFLIPGIWKYFQIPAYT